MGCGAISLMVAEWLALQANDAALDEPRSASTWETITAFVQGKARAHLPGPLGPPVVGLVVHHSAQHPTLAMPRARAASQRPPPGASLELRTLSSAAEVHEPSFRAP